MLSESSVARNNCGFQCLEPTDELSCSPGADANNPLLVCGMPIDASMPGFIAARSLMILRVPSGIADSQVGLPAIQRVTVDVVHHDAAVETEHGVVKADETVLTPSPRPTGSVEVIPRDAPAEMPIPLAETLVLFGINDGPLPARKRDKAVRLIQRLNNRLAWHATLGHGFTSNEAAAFSRIPILAAILGAATGVEEHICT